MDLHVHSASTREIDLGTESRISIFARLGLGQGCRRHRQVRQHICRGDVRRQARRQRVLQRRPELPAGSPQRAAEAPHRGLRGNVY